MVIGSLILLVGILIGYSIPFWRSPFVKKLGRISLKNDISDIFNQKAKIIDMSPDVDLN